MEELLVDSHKVLNRWKNNFCQHLNIHGLNDVRQTEMHAAKQVVYFRGSNCY
jgi:hypothetical protein